MRTIPRAGFVLDAIEQAVREYRPIKGMGLVRLEASRFTIPDVPKLEAAIELATDDGEIEAYKDRFLGPLPVSRTGS